MSKLSLNSIFKTVITHKRPFFSCFLFKQLVLSFLDVWPDFWLCLLTRCILTDSLDYFFNERSSSGFGFGSMDSNSKLSVALQKLQDRSDGLMRSFGQKMVGFAVVKL
ncbi:unnamed protein product [Rhizophagus irregularis]|nr:unnamed protein product [Rhizophagus irregularis]